VLRVLLAALDHENILPFFGALLAILGGLKSFGRNCARSFASVRKADDELHGPSRLLKK
jgi:hypothetical protein